jgi:hypothetical protein
VSFIDGQTLRGFALTAVHSTFSHCVARCDTPASKDFYTACGGGIGFFPYGEELVDAIVRTEDCDFSDGLAEYGACLLKLERSLSATRHDGASVV